MHQKIATTTVGIIFTVVVPLLVSAMSPSLSLGAGVPAIGASILIGITVAVWEFAQHRTRKWRGKLLPIFVMIAGAAIYSVGGYWYFKTHTPNTSGQVQTISLPPGGVLTVPAPPSSENRPLMPTPMTFRQVFESDFQNNFGVGYNTVIRNHTQHLDYVIPVRIIVDDFANVKFMAILIQKELDPVGFCLFSLSHLRILRTHFESSLEIEGASLGDSKKTSTKYMLYSNIIYLYVDQFLSIEQKHEIDVAADSRGLVAQIRDNAYYELHKNDKKLFTSSIDPLPPINAVDESKPGATIPAVTDAGPTINPSAAPLPSPMPPPPPARTSPQTSP